MYTAIEYRYMDVPVEIHGTNDETALIEINAILIAVPIENLEVTKETDHANQTARIGTGQGSNQNPEEAQERQEVQED